MDCSELSQDIYENEHCDSKTNVMDTTEIYTPVSTSVALMNSYFDFVYAKALCEVMGMVTRQLCYGCQMDLPSQKDHDCIMDTDPDDDEYKIERYFSDMLNAVNEKNILQSWEEIVRISNISSEMIDLHKLLLESNDYLQIMKTERWCEKMKRMVLTINRIEDRLFRPSR